MSWILTFSGRAFRPIEPRVADVAVEDVAQALGNICRFTGHVREFYSVAQHAWHASHLVPPRLALPALLHDAAEAYLSDVARPVKPHLGRYAEIEDRLLRVVFAAARVPWPTRSDWSEIADADLRLLYAERNWLMPPTPEAWPEEGRFGALKMADLVGGTGGVKAWKPREAGTWWLERYHELSAVPALDQGHGA